MNNYTKKHNMINLKWNYKIKRNLYSVCVYGIVIK